MTAADTLRIRTYTTPLGELVLRRRRRPGGEVVFEVTLNGSFLMSSLVNVAERELARRALARVAGTPRRVVVGGLGLGYTALEALAHPGVEELIVVELLSPVVAWHREGCLPVGRRLAGDPRVRLVEADFFNWIAEREGGGDDAVLVDIDHSPAHWLHPRHAGFYGPEGLCRAAAALRVGGVLGVWSAAPPEPEFLRHLEAALGEAEAEVVRFHNPHVDLEDRNTLYFGRRTGA